VTLGRSTGSAVVATLTFTVTGNEPIRCSTLSSSEGVDFVFTRISRINSIVQTTEDVCTISVQSTAEPGDTNPRESSLAAASTFSVSDTAGNMQTVLSGSPQTIWVQRIARPVISLSATTETANLNAAMNGYTVTSSGGTVASYSLTGTLPAGVSFSTTTGRITGTPTVTQTATTYTITATNTSGSTTATFTLTVVRTCAQGGECVVGNTGPGGGTVFYVAAATFASTGSNCSTAGAGGTSTCLYLEAEPSIIRTGFWCSVNTAIGATAQSDSIGGGMSNTNAASFCTTGAIRVALDYSRTVSGVTYSDWHLPSFDELAQIYVQRNLAGIDIGTLGVYYWSSTEQSAGGGTSARVHQFNNGATNISAGKTGHNDFRIRVVRAFGPTN
jgi:hypothetical protein